MKQAYHFLFSISRLLLLFLFLSPRVLGQPVPDAMLCLDSIREMEKMGAKIMVLPELCITGYTCSDLFTHDILLRAAKEALFEIAELDRYIRSH